MLFFFFYLFIINYHLFIIETLLWYCGEKTIAVKDNVYSNDDNDDNSYKSDDVVDVRLSHTNVVLL